MPKINECYHCHSKINVIHYFNGVNYENICLRCLSRIFNIDMLILEEWQKKGLIKDIIPIIKLGKIEEELNKLMKKYNIHKKEIMTILKVNN